MELLSEVEGEPSSWPSAPSGLSTEAGNLPLGLVWQRLEGWIAYRWEKRDVTWILCGPGEWEPRLKPATIDTTERWDGSAWESVTLDDSPLGKVLEDATYRIKATVGSTDTPPEPVLEAYRRLAEYIAEVRADPSRGKTSVQDGDYSFDRPAAWAARALQYSGAADLLRSYRQ